MSASRHVGDADRQPAAAARRDRVFRALANRWRRAILELLRKRPHTTSELSYVLYRAGLSRFAVMQHLKMLERAELVVSFKRGRTRYYHLHVAPIQQVALRWLARFPSRTSRASRMIKNLARRPPH